GSVSHLAMAVILVGLIGSAMYVSERTEYLLYDEEADTVASTVKINGYELTYTGSTSAIDAETGRVVYEVNFDVTKNGRAVGTVTPKYEVNMMTSQSKLDASVLHFVGEDLFVVFSGFTSSAFSNAQSSMVVDVRVNPLISFVWAGFTLMLLGMGIAMFARRSPRSAAEVGKKAAAAELKAAKEAAAE
ncbi:MAG: cytochrome C assembly protein, partial [Eggerthellaceae bacterium]|nr:cytochrome C assembly protein [Eggerthellaceae bacterium]